VINFSLFELKEFKYSFIEVRENRAIMCDLLVGSIYVDDVHAFSLGFHAYLNEYFSIIRCLNMHFSPATLVGLV